MNHSIHYKKEYEHKYTGGFKQTIYEYLLEKESLQTQGNKYLLKENNNFSSVPIIHITSEKWSCGKWIFDKNDPNYPFPVGWKWSKPQISTDVKS